MLHPVAPSLWISQWTIIIIMDFFCSLAEAVTSFDSFHLASYETSPKPFISSGLNEGGGSALDLNPSFGEPILLYCRRLI